MDSTRRRLMDERTAAIARKDWAEMNRLTVAIAALPMKGVAPLTAKDITRWNKRHAS